MIVIAQILEDISKTSRAVVETATSVNSHSHERKQITSESILLIKELIERNDSIDKSFGYVYKDLSGYISGISENLKGFKKNVDHFKEIISWATNLKNRLSELSTEIKKLIDIVEEIRMDTDEIYSLAMNASIISSKYNIGAAVFDVLSKRLNDMSVSMEQSLVDIEVVVEPIKKGIENLNTGNTANLLDIEDASRNFIDFSAILEKQETSINELILKAYISGSKIESQKKMLNEIMGMVMQMDQDASEAINGSGNVMKIGGEMKEIIGRISSATGNGTVNLSNLDLASERSSLIWHTAQRVNEKSTSQLEFSFNGLRFCESLIKESKDLEKTVESFNRQSYDNNSMADRIKSGISDLTRHLDGIQGRIGGSNAMLKNFTDDYAKIYDILDILNNMLQSMNVISIYSRIEAARDPVEYQGFITIADNIRKLQTKIKRDLPQIEQNIRKSDVLINSITKSFEGIFSIFHVIRDNSNTIKKNLEDITAVSAEAANISGNILNDSLKLDMLLNDLRSYLTKLTEIVKKPIEGSAANIMRGKDIEDKCNQMKVLIEKTPLDQN